MRKLYEFINSDYQLIFKKQVKYSQSCISATDAVSATTFRLVYAYVATGAGA